jgi:hypothetical protein
MPGAGLMVISARVPCDLSSPTRISTDSAMFPNAASSSAYTLLMESQRRAGLKIFPTDVRGIFSTMTISFGIASIASISKITRAI